MYLFSVIFWFAPDSMFWRIHYTRMNKLNIRVSFMVNKYVGHKKFKNVNFFLEIEILYVRVVPVISGVVRFWPSPTSVFLRIDTVTKHQEVSRDHPFVYMSYTLSIKPHTHHRESFLYRFLSHKNFRTPLWQLCFSCFL